MPVWSLIRWVLCVNHMEPVKGFLGRYLRRKLIEMEISSRTRNVELVKIIDWVPRVWHRLNRFLETHSSSDVTIGESTGENRECIDASVEALFIPLLCGLQDPVSSCHVPWTWKAPGFGLLISGITPSSPTCWRQCVRDCRLGLVFVCRVIKHITILLFHIFPISSKNQKLCLLSFLFTYVPAFTLVCCNF